MPHPSISTPPVRRIHSHLTILQGIPGTYGAAASDISPNIAGTRCEGRIDYSKCAGQVPTPGYQGPACGTSNCGQCYRVTNLGGMNSSTFASGLGNSVVVQIIDSWPATNAHNYCKTAVAPAGRCGSSAADALDIDRTAYEPLTGKPFGEGPNLLVGITSVDCPPP